MTSQGQTKRTKSQKTKSDQAYTNHINQILSKNKKVKQSLDKNQICPQYLQTHQKTSLTKCQVIKIQFQQVINFKCQCVGI